MNTHINLHLNSRGLSEYYYFLTLCFCLFLSPMAFCQTIAGGNCQNSDLELIGEVADNAIVLKTGHFIPNVIPYDYSEDVVFRAIIEGGTPSDILLLIDGVEHPLQNQGVNTGAGPSGTIYELSIAPTLILSKLVDSDVFRVFVGFLEIYENGQRVARVNEFAQVWTPEIPEVPIYETENGIRHTDFVANIQMDIHRDNSGNILFQSAANDFYQAFDDRFDFLSLILVPGFNANRFHQIIKNSVSNIGLTLFDSSNAWGSQGRLKGFNLFPLPYFYDGASGTFSHETGHQWINFLNNTPYQNGIPHWPFCSHANSVMGISLAGSGAGGSFSNVLVPMNDGYAFIPDTSSRPGKFFQPMDLYLMGLLPPDSIPDVLIFNQATMPVVNQVYPESAFTEYTKDDLLEDMGARIPVHSSSRKDFNTATLLISQEPLSDTELYFYDYFTRRAEAKVPLAVHEGFVKEIANPFYVSTHARATMTTRLIDCQVVFTAVNDSICEGDSYEFGSQTLTSSGIYQNTFPASNGCDSVVTLSLNVLPDFKDSIFTEICQGDTIFFHGQPYHKAGTYVQSLTSMAGCDSTVTLELAVIDRPAIDLGEDLEITIADTIVIGVDPASEQDDYLWNTGADTHFITVEAPDLGLGDFEFILTVRNERNCEASDTLTITISEVTGVPGPWTAGSFNVFPNPFLHQLFFDLELRRSGHLELAIFDIFGRRMETIHEGRVAAGRHHFTWVSPDLSLAAGLYFYRIQLDREVVSRPVALKQ